MRNSGLTYHLDALILESESLCGFLWWWEHLYRTPPLCARAMAGKVLRTCNCLLHGTKGGAPWKLFCSPVIKSSRVYGSHWILLPSRVLFSLMHLYVFFSGEQTVHLQKSIRTWNSTLRSTTNRNAYMSISTISPCPRRFTAALPAI